jgi:RNA polymerase sigma-70 factor (ECF subfamily)
LEIDSPSGEEYLDEAYLIHHARQGDGNAWEILMRQHQEAVFRLAYLMLGDADQAEDVAQEVFIRAFRSLHRFDLSRPVRPWLLRIAANLSRNQQRSAGRYFAALRRTLLNADPPASIEKIALGNLEAESLWQAVRSLPMGDQQIIYLRFFLEIPVHETAAVLDIAEGTVKSRLHRALDHLRTIIDRRYPALKEGRSE